MVRRARQVIVPVLLLAAALPSHAHAQDTGGTAAPQPDVVSVSDGSYTVSTRSGALLGRSARFLGSVRSANAGRTITVERLEPLTGQWLPSAQTTVGSDGSFVAKWRTDSTGRFRVRVRLEAASPGGAQASSASPELAVTVYKPATATWYGPGFYGRRTACGRKMTRTLLGVAHKKLPCGTQVAVFYKGRTITVPVVDRGPFREKTTWDLTAGTAKALGFAYTDTVGALQLSR
jgi:hypothetical protein